MNSLEIRTARENAQNLFKKCSPIFLVLGDYVRQKLLLDISDGGEDGVNIASLTEQTNLSRPAVAYHLKMLKDCGLIKTSKKGAQVFYFLNLEEKFSLITGLVEQMQKLVIMKNKQQASC